MISNRDWAELSAFLRSLRVENSPVDLSEFREAAEQYLRLLLEKNEHVNLTSVRELEVAFWKHLADSLAVLALEPMGKVVDWGSGGGLPGIPLALSRRAQGDPTPVFFLDSVGKKVRAVEEFAERLEITGARFFNGRGEELIKNGSLTGVESVVMRAVAPAERAHAWIHSSIPRWIFLLSPAQLPLWEREERKIARRGFQRSRLLSYDLPRSVGARLLLEYSK